MHINPSIVINYKKFKIAIINFSSRNKKIIIPLLFVLCYISLYFLIDLSTQSLVAHDEGLYARRARLIEDSDNWFSPPFPSPHHKTLGSYWFIAVSIRLFGNSELALRLPSILSSFICLISSYLIALKITNKKAALISVFALSSMPLWIQYSRYASPDLPFVLCILLSILFFLKALENKHLFLVYIYFFSSGLFISASFFIRSYMALVPFIGLSPFIFYHLFKKGYIIKIYYSIGILLGSIPTIFNLYYSYQSFGNKGLTSLFEFARKQAIGDIYYDNLFFLALKFLYYTFPIGILFLTLLVFTKSAYNSKYPLLIYCYPVISLIILLCMSTSYPHYFLFLLPSFSIIFANQITSYKFKFSLSKNIIKYILSVTIIFVSSILLFSIINYKEYIIKYSNSYSLIVYILSSLLIISNITSIRFLFDIRYKSFNLTKFFYNIVVPQFIFISLLFNVGILGSPNNNIKQFLKDDSVSKIINSNTIYLLNVDSKIQTLLSYYLPSSKVIDSLEVFGDYDYVITSDSSSLTKSDINGLFKSIKKFDNHLLLVKNNK